MSTADAEHGIFEGHLSECESEVTSMTSTADAEPPDNIEAIRARYHESMERFGRPVLNWDEVERLFDEIERLRRQMTAHRETYVAAIAGSEKEILRLRQRYPERVGISRRRPYRGRPHRSHCSCTYEVERLRQQNAELEKFARTWAQHGTGCTYGLPFFGKKCICGMLDDWRAALAQTDQVEQGIKS